MTPLLPFRFDEVLCIGAHVDDIEIGCGGTIWQMMSSKNPPNLRWIVFSASETRKLEAIRSVNAIPNSSKIHMEVLDFKDSFFPSEYTQIKQKFDELRRDIKPDLIFTHCRSDRHQDHSLLAELTWNTFRNHLIFEYEIPKYEGDLGQPNVYSPIADETAEQKCDWIMNNFVSQLSKHWLDPELLMGLLRLRGIESGRKNFYAEAFYCDKFIFNF